MMGSHLKRAVLTEVLSF
jgi:hypothetical protein